MIEHFQQLFCFNHVAILLTISMCNLKKSYTKALQFLRRTYMKKNSFRSFYCNREKKKEWYIYNMYEREFSLFVCCFTSHRRIICLYGTFPLPMKGCKFQQVYAYQLQPLCKRHLYQYTLAVTQSFCICGPDRKTAPFSRIL